jgi:acyl-CoA synthetase (AMP-forming)/AMP-acid ligase II
MAITSPYPGVDVPAASLGEYVLGGAAARGDKPALIDGASGAVTTYAELAERIAAAAGGLAADGIGKGDVVALIGPNSVEWAVAYHAAIALGATVSPLNPILTAEEVHTQLATAGARSAIVAPALRAAVDGAGLERVYAIDALPAAAPPPAPPIDPAQDLATLPFSSGTTGLSKGVMLAHRNLVANMEQIGAIHRIGADDVLIGALPFFHIYGQVVVLNLGLSRGATIVTMPRFDMTAFLDLLERHRVTRAHIAPPVVLGLAKVPGIERRDLALRVVISGAAPLDAETALRAGERLGAPVRQGYGMTEASPVTHFADDDQLEDADPGAIGYLVPDTEARLIDPETGRDSDERGELLIRGPQVMRGYLRAPEASSATLSIDGWLRTGDVAEIDAEGVFRIVDRVKELIKYKGYQVPPAELEALLVGHPAIADAAVIPIPHEDGGEAPKACVVLADGAELDAAELMAWVAERVAPYKRIRAVEFVDEIPKSASGKILRRLLRDHG